MRSSRPNEKSEQGSGVPVSGSSTGPPERGGPVACAPAQSALGEGAVWDARRAELLRVDILEGHVHRDGVAADGELVPVRTYLVPGTVGAITPIAGDPGWLLAAGRGFVHLGVDGALHPLSEVCPAGTRMNDGACDPQGRFWAGTLADDHHAGGGALFRLDRSGRTELVLSGLSISNGLDWSPDGTTMYLVDSGPGVVYAFAFDAERGTLSRQRTLLTIVPGLGAPDGMTVDAAGDLWIAIYGAGQVHRYSPDGVLRQVVGVPAAQSTSCAFAGPSMQWLYITTATEGWTDAQRRSEPGAGRVYRVATESRGVPARPFRPDPTWWTEACR